MSRLTRRLVRGVTVLLAGVLLAGLAFLAAFHGMQYYLRSGQAAAPQQRDARHDEAAQLRRDTNEAVRLMEDYLRRFPLDRLTGGPDAEAWAQGPWRERLAALQARLARPGRTGPEPLGGLRGVVNRMFTMLAHPSDPVLRRAVAEQLHAVCAEANHYILGLEGLPPLDEPPLPFDMSRVR